MKFNSTQNFTLTNLSSTSIKASFNTINMTANVNFSLISCGYHQGDKLKVDYDSIFETVIRVNRTGYITLERVIPP